MLGIENLSLAPRWAETISTIKALVTQRMIYLARLAESFL